MVRPPVFAAPAQPSARAPTSAPAQVQPQPSFHPPAVTSLPATVQPGQQAQHQEEPDAGGWAEVRSRKPAPTAALAVPQPAALTRASSGAGGLAGSSPAGSAGKNGGWGSAGGGKAGGGGGGSRKPKGVGYEDDKARWVDGAANKSCLGVPAESRCNLLDMCTRGLYSLQSVTSGCERPASPFPCPFPPACGRSGW